VPSGTPGRASHGLVSMRGGGGGFSIEVFDKTFFKKFCWGEKKSHWWVGGGGVRFFLGVLGGRAFRSRLFFI